MLKQIPRTNSQVPNWRFLLVTIVMEVIYVQPTSIMVLEKEQEEFTGPGGDFQAMAAEIPASLIVGLVVPFDVKKDVCNFLNRLKHNKSGPGLLNQL